MSLPLVLARVAAIETAFTPPSPDAPAATGASPASAGMSPTGTVSFGGALRGALAVSGQGGAAPGIVAAARTQLGVTEQPPGSNDGPSIAMYRTAVPGGGVGAWCAYFVSWCAKQAGHPLGDSGQGFAGVDALWAWAQGSGRAVPNGPGVTPRPGDVVVFHEHVGIVESVDRDGSIHTIEGNTSDSVARRTHAAGEAVGYVHVT